MKIIPVILLLILSINIAHAQEGIVPKLIEYDVEVIIFEDAHARYINSEYWHEDSEQISSMTATGSERTKQSQAETNTDYFKKENFRTIKPGIISKEYRRINNSSEYNVLFYGSWRQTGLDESKTFDINIEELKNTHKTTSENTLTGNFKLVLARYLHIYAEMEYHRNQAEANLNNVTENIALENRPYPIDIHRRMRSKELHYIDHPLLGMLIQINPVKASAKKATTEETAEKPAAP